MVVERVEGLTELIRVASPQCVIGEDVGETGETVGEELHAGQDVGMNMCSRAGSWQVEQATPMAPGLMTARQRSFFSSAVPDGPGVTASAVRRLALEPPEKFALHRVVHRAMGGGIPVLVIGTMRGRHAGRNRLGGVTSAAHRGRDFDARAHGEIAGVGRVPARRGRGNSRIARRPDELSR
jgi:hypothetical protein